MSPSDRAHLVSDTLASLSSAPVKRGDVNSCGVCAWQNKSVVHVDSHGVVHASSGGAVVHRNSCVPHGA